MLTAWTSSQPSSNVIMDYAPGSSPICIDTGASSCVSNNISDFISLENYNSTVQGIGSGLSIKGKGTLQWFLLDNSGQEITLFVKDALHVPQVPMNLLYPQQIAQQTGKASDGFNAQANSSTLTLDGFSCTIKYSNQNNLPLFFSSKNSHSTRHVTPTANQPCAHIAAFEATATNEPIGTETNLSKVQCRLLSKHKSLGHLHMNAIQKLARTGNFGLSWTDIGSCDKPLCLGCF
jgi:hypothetical protein